MRCEKERKPKHFKCSGFPLSVITNYGGPRVWNGAVHFKSTLL